MVPKLSFRPDASAAAMASDRTVVAGSCPSRRAAAAAAPRVPMVEVACQPCS